MKEILNLANPIDTTVVDIYNPFANRLYIRNPGARTVISYYDDKNPVAK